MKNEMLTDIRTSNYPIAYEQARKRARQYAYECLADLLIFRVINATQVSVELRMRDGVLERRVIEY